MFKSITISKGASLAKIIPERGGIVAEFTVGEQQILYMDKETLFDLSKNVRGGIPILFPQAGSLKEGSKYPLKQHGFARNMPWKVRVRDRERIILELSDTEETRKLYPFSFNLSLVIEVREMELIHQMTITNTGEETMPIAYGLHPYFYMPTTEKAEIQSNIEGLNPHSVNWEDIFDKRFINPGKIDIKTFQRSFSLITDSEMFPHLAIWSLPEKDFICIEPWSKLDGALENSDSSVLISPNQSLNYRFVIHPRVMGGF